MAQAHIRAMDATKEMAARIEGRLERTGHTAEELDRLAGLPPGTAEALCTGRGRVPTGGALRRLAVALETDEEFLLGLQPGDLIPAELLEEPQGELGLLAPDEEALLRHYRRLDVPARAAFALVLARAAGPEPEPSEANRPPRRKGRRAANAAMPLTIEGVETGGG
ncbi:MAG TPA: helix-turn-helix transcriptional regulator [Acetobacteraceae bacterium]|nr:helix-turn-helix transcriptional regulator [Acetobacteraceae bacterium]